ncbi:polysaccharide deacetylase [Phyllobacterium phragmitis]|uniref:Chitooligosaccharide deacetylase n=1 Tax=Phyllobacterium phragmitis TaxID=2670329 RepID=A0A2S9IMR9_9HYPH|nr:polysaccharide deacetylase family protein [Phyllobacterium phragmitis]PRD41829.1 polysaccharide deacetylase [Phyllobacterium phragmitis]
MSTWKTSATYLAKHAVIRAGMEAVALTRAGRFLPNAAGRGVIFTLHHVRPPTEPSFRPNAHLSVTPHFLRQAIETALEAGLVPAHLHDLPRLLADRDDTRRFVSFTLDDGYRDNIEYAAPIFRQFAMPYTIFITRGFIERKRTIWWETAQALLGKVSSFTFDFGSGLERVASATPAQRHHAFARLARFVQAADEDEAVAHIDAAARDNGIDPVAIVDDLVMTGDELRALATDPLFRAGAHTLTHVNLARVDEARLVREIGQSADAVAEWCGYRPESFCYPYGTRDAVSEQTQTAVVDAGFALAVTTRPGVLRTRDPDTPALFPRVSLNGHYQKKRYVEALLSGIPFIG